MEKVITHFVAPQGVSVTVENVQGILPFYLKIKTINIADKTGDLAKIRGLRIDFAPLMLLRAKLQIKNITLDHAEWIRPDTISPKMDVKTNISWPATLSMLIPRILHQRLLNHIMVKTLKTPTANLSLRFEKKGIESIVEVKSISDNPANNKPPAIGTFHISPKDKGAIATLYIKDSAGIFLNNALFAEGNLHIADIDAFQPVGTISITREMQKTTIQLQSVGTDTNIYINQGDTIFACDLNIKQTLEDSCAHIKNARIKTPDYHINGSGALIFKNDLITLSYEGDNTSGITVKGEAEFNAPKRMLEVKGAALWKGTPIEFKANINDLGTNTNIKSMIAKIENRTITLNSQNGIFLNQEGGTFTLTADEHTINGKASFDRNSSHIQLIPTCPWVKNSIISILLNENGATVTGTLDIDCNTLTNGMMQGNAHIKAQLDHTLTGTIACTLPHLTLNNITYENTNGSINLTNGDGSFIVKTGDSEQLSPQGLIRGHFSLNTKKLAINTFHVSFEKHLIALATPIHLDLEKETLPPLTVSIDNKGKIKYDPAIKRLVFENVSVLAARLFAPQIELDGMLNGAIDIVNPNQYKGRLELTKIQPYSSIAKSISDNSTFRGFSCTLLFEHQEKKLLIDLFTQRNKTHLFRAKGGIALDAATFAQNTADIHLTGQLDISLLCSILNIPDRLAGIVNTNLALKGTLTDINFFGRIDIKDGLYDSADNGTYIANIEGSLKASGRKLIIESMKGNDLRELKHNARQGHHVGTLDISGYFEFAEYALPHSVLHLKLNDLIVVHRDDMTMRATGNIQIKGAGLQSKITGSVHLTPSLVMLEEISKDKILSVDIDHLPSHNEKKKKSNNPVFPIELELIIDKNFYIRDLDLSLMSQWTGNMIVKGNLSDPYLEGHLNVVNGKFSLFGKQLKISEAKITYDSEDENNPRIWLVGTRTVEDVKMRLQLSGRASDTKVTFVSDPALPEDEILARLLFGKELSKISAGQSIQLASVGASLNHNQGLNFIETLRNSFGFDTLELKEDEVKANNTESGQTGAQSLRVGKEFENIRISIDQSIGNTGSKATVSTALGKNVYLDLEVGEKRAGSGAGLSWVFRY